MSLSLYRKKRSFTKTTEPQGGKNTTSQLRFVVQKHDASHLHYDFRLEMNGVLKSWAVPKGPSLDPGIKRLAMMVEDHPFDYRNFEGIIPEGNYGAGTVIVWDEGTYEPADANGANKKSLEKELLAGLKKRRLKITLHGSKLKGDFALVKTGAGAENAWLLMKLDDKYASEKDITLKDKSVVTKRTLAQVGKANGVPVSSKKTERRATAKKIIIKSATKKTTVKKKAQLETIKEKGHPDADLLIEHTPKTFFPAIFKPMLATRVAEPFDGEDWIFEIKWDGYRAVAYLQKNKVNIYSRNLLSFNTKFASVYDALQELNTDAVLDGEIVALDEDDKPSFQLLQNHAGNNTRFAYYVFDITWLQGKDLRGLSLLERKMILESILPPGNPVIRYSSHVETTGKDFFKVAVQHGLEGVMAKNKNSSYTIGRRSCEWLKIKNDHRMEAVICGFTKPRNSRSYFGAVILGKYSGKTLQYIGHSGSGFDEKMLATLHKKFKQLITDECPFKKIPKTNMPVTWLKPELVCEVKFTEWTSEKILRHSIFLGMREDKKAENEKNEKVVQAPSSPQKKTAASKNKTLRSIVSSDSKEQVVKVKGHNLKLTNLDKLYWPKEKITKRDLLKYYADMAPYILPYLKDRAQSLNRHPDGIDKPGFYYKNIADSAPDWLTTFPYSSDNDNKTTNYLVCKDEADLLYMASQGCIEMNPWHSRVPDIDYPDWSVIDLDPDTNTFNKVIETANVIKQILDSAGIDSYCKTSGSTGLHIYIPLGAKYTYEQSRLLAQLVVQMAQSELPSFTSIERNPAKRKGKIYLDYLQNKTTQTIAAPYSVRPKPGAPVSTPLLWKEVKKGLTIKEHNMFTIKDRVREIGDIFKPVLGKGINMKKVLLQIESLK